mmetsp:Transcript_879/g.2483  ORF Transcript_879/g.2483 Transcript_879/m.2483 type:complete len:216 (-) Transcript_879:688-1335(-)
MATTMSSEIRSHFFTMLSLSSVCLWKLSDMWSTSLQSSSSNFCSSPTSGEDLDCSWIVLRWFQFAPSCASTRNPGFPEEVSLWSSASNDAANSWRSKSCCACQSLRAATPSSSLDHRSSSIGDDPQTSRARATFSRWVWQLHICPSIFTTLRATASVTGPNAAAPSSQAAGTDISGITDARRSSARKASTSHQRAALAAESSCQSSTTCAPEALS